MKPSKIIAVLFSVQLVVAAISLFMINPDVAQAGYVCEVYISQYTRCTDPNQEFNEECPHPNDWCVDAQMGACQSCCLDYWRWCVDEYCGGLSGDDLTFCVLMTAAPCREDNGYCYTGCQFEAYC